MILVSVVPRAMGDSGIIPCLHSVMDAMARGKMAKSAPARLQKEEEHPLKCTGIISANIISNR